MKSIFLICNQSFKCQCSLLAFWLDTKNHRPFVENSPDPECSFLQWTCSTPWTIPSSVSLNAASLEPKPEKQSDLWGEVTDSKRHHCSSKGYTTECRCTAEHDVAPISHRLGNNQPHTVQQQYCQNLGFHQHTTECQRKLLLLFMMFW